MEKVKHYNGITREDILEVLELRDGKFYWKVSVGSSKAGDEVKHIREDGYCRVQVKGKRLYTGRMAFLVYHGWLPKDYRKYQIDHKNRIRNDNRKSNLRCVTQSQNQMNSNKAKGLTSKYLGVSWAKHVNKWATNITVNGKQKHIGIFDTEEEAGLAYDEQARAHFGEYANPNFKE